MSKTKTAKLALKQTQRNFYYLSHLYVISQKMRIQILQMTIFFSLLFLIIIFLQVNLLELFPASADRGQHPKCSKQQGILLDCWLRLILALSFHADGQLNFLKIRGLYLL